MNETKRDRFIRVMTNRVTKILEAVDQLSKCADHRSYDYTPDMVDRAFQQIVDQLGQVRSIFDTETGRKTFSLSNAGWYWISADNGNTWTKQILTTEEASEHLAVGYMLKKTEPLEEQPRIKVIAVYDNDSNDLTVYSTSPNLDCETIDTGSADPSDDDYEEHDEENQARIDELNAAVTRGELFCLA